MQFANLNNKKLHMKYWREHFLAVITMVLSTNISPRALEVILPCLGHSQIEKGWMPINSQQKYAAEVLLFTSSLTNNIKRRMENSTFGVILPQGTVIWIWSFGRGVQCHTVTSHWKQLREKRIAPNTLTGYLDAKTEAAEHSCEQQVAISTETNGQSSVKALPGFLLHKNYCWGLFKDHLLSLQQCTSATSRMSVQRWDRADATETTTSTPLYKQQQVKQQQQEFLLPVADTMSPYKVPAGISPLCMPTIESLQVYLQTKQTETTVLKGKPLSWKEQGKLL